jgi:hypothetical protein
MTELVKTYFHDGELAYTELYSHFAYKNFGVAGDSVVSFVGPCDVSGDDLVDLADRAAGDYIKAAKMLHFIVEHFAMDLLTAVRHQRLLCAALYEYLTGRSPGPGLRRDGDDLYVGDGKLTVSIATVSPVSALIHLGINIDAAGAPVKTADLSWFANLEPKEVAVGVMKRYADEVDGIHAAAVKVRPVD